MRIWTARGLIAQGAAIGCEKDPHLAADIEWQADELSKGKEDGMK